MNTIHLKDLKKFSPSIAAPFGYLFLSINLKTRGACSTTIPASQVTPYLNENGEWNYGITVKDTPPVVKKMYGSNYVLSVDSKGFPLPNPMSHEVNSFIFIQDRVLDDGHPIEGDPYEIYGVNLEEPSNSYNEGMSNIQKIASALGEIINDSESGNTNNSALSEFTYATATMPVLKQLTDNLDGYDKEGHQVAFSKRVLAAIDYAKGLGKNVYTPSIKPIDLLNVSVLPNGCEYPSCHNVDLSIFGVFTQIAKLNKMIIDDHGCDILNIVNHAIKRAYVNGIIDSRRDIISKL